jgi:hypothetical protein
MTKKILNKKFGVATISMFLVLTMALAFVFMPFDKTLTAHASTAGSNIVSGIDYSGQGTRISEDLRDGVATVEGNYVRVPTYTYGSYVYSTWDEFWASWSSWSPDNAKYNGYKGYRYAPENKHIVDFKSKTEYQYRRWNSNLNPVYKTKYVTEYEKCTTILFVKIYTYHTESSYSGYPGAKSGYSIFSRWTERVVDYYAGGYEYNNNWSDGAPFTWPWETSWSAYTSRQTYRVKKIDSTWDAKWKNDSSDLVPLNYSLKDRNGQDIGVGIKLAFSKPMSEYKETSNLFLSTSLWVNQYYISATDAKRLLIDNMEDIEDAIGRFGFINLIVDLGSTIGGVFLSTPVGVAIGLAMLMVEGSDYLMNELKAGRINTMQKLLTEAERQNITIIIQDTNYAVYSTNMQYYQSFQTAVTKKTSVSMRMSDNDIKCAYLTGTKNYGKISYMSDINEAIQMIKFSLKYNYPVFLPWNW